MHSLYLVYQRKLNENSAIILWRNTKLFFYNLELDSLPRLNNKAIQYNDLFYLKWSISNLILTTAKWVCLISELCKKWTAWGLFTRNAPLAIPTKAIMLHNL